MRRSPTHLPLRFALILAIILLAGAGATPASAGIYPVHACDPRHRDVNNSWQALSNRKGILVYVACHPRRGSLGPWDQGLVTRAMINRKNKGATIPKGASARLVFTAPPGAALLQMNYVGSLCGSAGHMALIQADLSPVTFDINNPPLGCRSLIPTSRQVPLNLRTSVSLRTTCVLTRCRTGGGKPRAWAAMRSATVWVWDTTLPSISVAAPTGWQRGQIDVRYVAKDNVGLRHARLESGGATQGLFDPSCDYTRATPCSDLASAFSVNTRSFDDGARTFTIHAQDAAGNSVAQPLSLQIDNTAPGPPLGLSVVGGTQWRSTNSFAAEWRTPSQPGTAPVTGVHTAVCPASADVEDWSACVGGPQRSSDEPLTGLQVPRAGTWVLRVWLQDSAGNHDRQTALSVPLNFDDTLPSVDIAPMDNTDPTRIDVQASDPTSPLAHTELEIRRDRTSAWIGLPTTSTPTGFSARLDDEVLPDGTYELRARATDSAGNERSTYREASGKLAVRQVPARVDTRLVAGQVKVVKSRTPGGRRRTRRVVVVRPKVLFGQTIPIRGRLTMAGDNAVANATIEVWEQLRLRGAVPRRVAVIGTDGSGRFTYKAVHGPSRVLRFRYPGTAVIRARATEVDLRVRGTSTLGVNRRQVVNGEDIVLRGRVRGGLLPAVGKLVQLQAYSRGRWLTFATPRANQGTGRWSYRYRFTATRGTVRYRFRARLPQEAGFPYISGVSRSVRVLVRGL